MNSINIQVGKIYESLCRCVIYLTEETTYQNMISYTTKKDLLLVLKVKIDKFYIISKVLNHKGIIGWIVTTQNNIHNVITESTEQNQL